MKFKLNNREGLEKDAIEKNFTNFLEINTIRFLTSFKEKLDVDNYNLTSPNYSLKENAYFIELEFTITKIDNLIDLDKLRNEIKNLFALGNEPYHYATIKDYSDTDEVTHISKSLQKSLH